MQAIGKQWWSGDPTQRYWMELVNVDSWGSELVAPDEPRHALMYDVAVGDVVYHWVGKNNPQRRPSGMYGVSVVAGNLQRDAGEWLGQPANTIELTGYTAFDPPLLLGALRSYQQQIFDLIEGLHERERQQTLHFPFQKHPTAGLKPNQRYLSKLPAELLDIVSELRPDSDWGGLENPVITPPIDPAIPEFRRRYSGICMDPVLRKSIEVAAVDQATAHYLAQGYEVQDVGLTHSYDLLVTRGDEVRHVEVKGSQGAIFKIQLTRNEVLHADVVDNTDLVLVSEIQWERLPDGSIKTGGGLMDVIPNWTPSVENLKPLTYEYFLD
ncbi:hypothetical protein D477_017949 [Arthrobacter crystallopoietes BAB-32]|uniref:Protein NO VEIN C-terminal domain-containing protein n=1 Tax=Arthrobacter crystallopoietes BAB-32 TaxID=1246476 RepID=N1UYF4_9MICC|nr:DUF3883 domain-containing protein [Arthrobacter crystallopoietes]EMY32857.1 hypothetical protein D477_017949 [Arthrobacter crystallopoietes BAB-32]